MKFLRPVTMRLIKALTVIFSVVIANFFLIRMAPGDPASIMAGEAGASDPDYVNRLREQFGLTEPLLTQLWIYLKGVVHFDWGYSYRMQVSVLHLILERLPATLLLMGAAFIFSIILGILFGVLSGAARKRPGGGWLDSLIVGVSLILYATPLFWLSLLVILLFSVQLGWLPAYGMEAPGSSLTGWARFGDIASHLVLPTVSLGSFYMAMYVRLTRASVLDVIGMDFVKTARAKGVPPRRILRRHVLRNAMLPVITFSGIQLGQMAGGAVLTETVFGWPGIGRLMFDALLQRDYQLLLGVFLVTAAMVVLFNILTDIFYSFVDPRIGAGGQK